MTLGQLLIASLLVMRIIVGAKTEQAVIVKGTFSPTALEDDECYFPIGGVVVMTKPDSIECSFIREHLLNRPGKLMFVVEE